MGCGGIKVANDQNRPPSLEVQLEKQKRDLEYQVETNNIKLNSLEKEIEEIDKKVKEGENNIKLNQYQLKEEELKSKAKKLIELKRDRARLQKTLEQISSMNETLKNNLDSVTKKIIENQNMKAIKNQNVIMDQYEKENVTQAIGMNVANLKRQKEEDEKVQKILQRGNDAYIGNDNFKDEDAYLRDLLGRGTTSTPF